MSYDLTPALRASLLAFNSRSFIVFASGAYAKNEAKVPAMEERARGGEPNIS
jgi:hypothetical protein